MVRDVGWCCRLPLQPCQPQVLRAYSPSAVTNLNAFITTTTGDVSHAGNLSIYTYRYDNAIWRVWLNGEVSHNNSNDDVGNSYGLSGDWA